MDVSRLNWEAFRFVDDTRQWKQLAIGRRCYLAQAASYADPDGTGVKISVNTFAMAAGKRSTAFVRLDDLEAMGMLLPELHVDETRNGARKAYRIRGHPPSLDTIGTATRCPAG